jgi:hypothetical protein
MGFGPTLAAEKLTAEKLPVSDETLRNWLLEAGLWERKRRRQKHRQRRERRECFRELTQADGSKRDWLEGRGHMDLLKRHRPLHSSIALAAILSLQEKRKIANDYTIRLDNRVYQLLPPAQSGLCDGRGTVGSGWMAVCISDSRTTISSIRWGARPFMRRGAGDVDLRRGLWGRGSGIPHPGHHR